MRSRIRLIGLIAACFVAVAACGSGDSVSDTTTASGFIFMDSNGSRICGLMAESFPPQCGEPSVKLLDLKPESIVALTSPEDPALASVAWTDYSTSVEGVLGPNGLSGVKVLDPVHVAGGKGLVLRVADLGIRVNEPVTWPLDLTNSTDTDTTLTFSNGQRLELMLSDKSGEVYRWSDGMFFTQAIAQVDLAAGETTPYLLRADALGLPLGEYTARAWVTATEAADVVLTWTVVITS